MSADKTIGRVTNTEQQQAETYRYWHSLSVGERLSAVWEVSQAAYAFAAAFKGNSTNDSQRSERAITRVQRSRDKSGREQDILDVKKLRDAVPGDPEA
ncbi:MAG TPA: hypothetical protein VHA33_30410 [Candidatus Angelobacter sp.]|jgi:hypothetical protein|nr:hypothetical protein [Candidatus Angelobacter sp.]